LNIRVAYILGMWSELKLFVNITQNLTQSEYNDTCIEVRRKFEISALLWDKPGHYCNQLLSYDGINHNPALWIVNAHVGSVQSPSLHAEYYIAPVIHGMDEVINIQVYIKHFLELRPANP